MRVWLYGCNAQDIRAMRIHCVGGADIVIGFSTQKDRSDPFPRAGLARPMQAAMRGELDQLLVSSLSLLGDGGEQIGEMKKRPVLTMLSDCGALSDILSSGARLLECACGPCIGMGFSPNSGGVSLRTFNRNFRGRSGTADAKVYLVSPETAVAAALTGEITDPRELGLNRLDVDMPASFKLDDSALLPPALPEEAGEVEVLRGPNIKSIPEGRTLSDTIEAELTLKVGDNITTDHIMPAGAKILPYRSNIPKLSEFCFAVCDEDFSKRALAAGRSIVVGGANYGQGSSREHAALVPLYLGVRAVVAKSFARIHQANLINAGILPLTFKDPEDYDRLEQGEKLRLCGVLAGLETGEMSLQAKAGEIRLSCSFTGRQQAILKAGGLLNYTREGNK